MHRRSTRFALLAATVATLLFAAAPAFAMTLPEKDTVHTNVGLVQFTTADGRFRCSGTLIAPKVVLTAGHCTEGPATNMYVSFDTDLALDSSRRGHLGRGEGSPRGALHQGHSPSRCRTGMAGSTSRRSTTWASSFLMRARRPNGRASRPLPPLPPIAIYTGTRASSRTRPSRWWGTASRSATRRTGGGALPALHHVLLEERRRRGHHIPGIDERTTPRPAVDRDSAIRVAVSSRVATSWVTRPM